MLKIMYIFIYKLGKDVIYEVFVFNYTLYYIGYLCQFYVFMVLYENYELNGKYSDENKGINCFFKFMD